MRSVEPKNTKNDTAIYGFLIKLIHVVDRRAGGCLVGFSGICTASMAYIEACMTVEILYL